MRIVADRGIPWASSLFASLGEVISLDGRQINRAALANADILLTRTVTRVDQALLEGTPVQVVATATSGRDHIDTVWLESAGIPLFHAAGCNARSVAEYVISALCIHSAQTDRDLSGLSVGIVGGGHVGSLLASLLRAIGMDVRVCDPPLAATGQPGLVPPEAITECDIVTLHVPLIDDTRWPTRNMVDTAWLARLRPDVVLVNTSRGEVIDEHALTGFMDSRPDAVLILDVWCHEPEPDIQLLGRALLATPHIAGYSTDAKLRGTWMIYKQVCEFLGRDYNEQPMPALPEPEYDTLRLAADLTDAEALQMAVLAGYDVRTDSAALSLLPTLPSAQRAAYFTDLRNRYPVRREFPSLTLELAGNRSDLACSLRALGFTVKQQEAGF